MTSHHPQLVTAKLNQLHPTQLTVGKLEVTLKRQQWNAMNRKARAEALDSHWFPAVAGPDGNYFIVDHHHFGLALIEEDVKQVSLMILKDLSWLEHGAFWNAMDHHQWVHPFDGNGVRQKYHAVPEHLTHLQDDPYRSLAGEVRRAGGYAKDATPFSEFLWADFFRPQIARELIEEDFSVALAQAKQLAATPAARYLPGWCGPIAQV